MRPRSFARHALVASIFVFSNLGAAEKPTRALTVYTNLTVIDGTGAPAATGMAIIVEGERIKSVLPMTALASSPVTGATVVDLAGKFALPGLIDTHQHVGTTPNRPAAEAQLHRMLYGGVTAVVLTHKSELPSGPHKSVTGSMGREVWREGQAPLL